MTPNEILFSGENNLTYDAGYYRPATIGNYTWEDVNGNGLQDAGEPAIPGVTVTLTGTNGLGNAVTLVTTTDASGLYLFTNLIPGTYKLTFGTLAGYTLTYANQGGNDAIDSDPDQTTLMTVNEVLVSGEDNRDYDAGYYRPASIGNYVWDDKDGDGTQEAGEPGIPGVTVVLSGTTGNGTAVSLTTTTDSNGLYSFNNLVPGTYKVTFTTPTGGYTATAPDQGDDANDSDVNPTTGMTPQEILVSGENNTTYDAGYFIPATIGDYVWEDIDGDGIQDAGEAPISGVTVVLSGTNGLGANVNLTTTTDAAGLYLFTNLVPGTYKLTFTTPATYTVTKQDQGINDAVDSDVNPATGMTINEVLTSGEDNRTYDAGYYKPASIGNFVWDDTNGNGIQDSGEPGISGVTVILTGTDGSGASVSLTTPADSNGQYLFGNLVPGTYKLTFNTPAGYTVTAIDRGGNDALDSDVDKTTGMTVTEVLVSGENNLDYDAGYYKPASIGDYVWDDKNGDGIQTAGEPGVSGVVVTLTGTDGSGAAVNLTTTTDATGAYLFSNLVPGTYTVTVTAPANYSFTAPDQGGDDAKDSDSNPATGAMPAEVLVSGENNLTYDAGIYIPAKLGDYVWEDVNANGLQDAGEAPISGVTVVLSGTTGTGTVVSVTTTTDVAGLYLFSNLVPGTYKVTFTTPIGYTTTFPDKGADNVDSDADRTTGMTVTEILESGEDNRTYDAGYFKPASIGDFVWEDTNGNGIQDAGEPGLGGVTVVLTGTDGNGLAVSLTTTTAANGAYTFNNLVPGTYKLTFTTPANYTATAPDRGGNDAIDSDADQTTGMTVNEVLVSGENNTTYDAGFFRPASLGNYTWEDTNANGIQDSGEPVISGVVVTLSGTDGLGNAVAATTTTDASGLYLFNNLLPGTYKVTFTKPTGYSTTYADRGSDDTRDSDADVTTGMTVNEVLVSGEQNLTYDAGYYKPASIGDFVWDDTNGNGIQDGGEPGIPGVTVVLTGTDGGGNVVNLTTTTGANGQYTFGNLVPGTYTVTVTNPSGFTFTPANQGGDDAKDSDSNPTTGAMPSEVLTSGENNTTYDAGLYRPASLGNYTWEDTNANGIQDGGEPIISNVTVVLSGTTGAGAPVGATTTTDASGLYLFSNLAPGNYKVTFTVPAGYTTTFPDKGADNIDSDADRTTGMTVNEVLVSGENNLDYDAGYFKPASIGNFVWDDINANGIQDSGEPGISGVTVVLSGTDGSGNIVNATTTTGISGDYLFTGLAPGTYKVTFTAPAGYTATFPDKGSDDTKDSDADRTTGMTINEVLISGETNLTYDAGYFKPAS